jgi:hypothetical protein
MAFTTLYVMHFFLQKASTRFWINNLELEVWGLGMRDSVSAPNQWRMAGDDRGFAILVLPLNASDCWMLLEIPLTWPQSPSKRHTNTYLQVPIVTGRPLN